MPLKIHEREAKVRRVQSELSITIHETLDTNELTDGERLKVIMSICSDYVLSVAKYAIREERHGDPARPGGLANDED